MVKGGDGPRLDQELVDSNQTHNVTTGHILNGLHIPSHHQDGPLNGLYIQVLLLPRSVVWTHDPYFLPCCYHTRKDASKGIKASLVTGRNHFGDVHHQRTFGVTALDSDGSFIVSWALVQKLTAVLLGG